MPRSLILEITGSEFGNVLLVDGVRGRRYKSNTGAYDRDILCRDCDGEIGAYDKYALAFVKYAVLQVHPAGWGWITANIDQAKLKLFCMAYLWRASITTHPAFADVSLGNKHEERLRQMLLQRDAGAVDDYTVLITRYSNVEENFAGVPFPSQCRLGQGIKYYAAGLPRMYNFLIKVDSQEDLELRKMGLGMYRDMFVGCMGDFHTSPAKYAMATAVQRVRANQRR